MSKGIDVSNNNGHVNWPRIKADGYTYAMAKATEGLGFVDQFYEQNRAGAEAEGMKFGAYHFFTPGEDVAAQVSFFLAHAKPKHGEIVPTLDYERLPATRAPAEEFVTVLERQLGHWPMFYSYLSFIEGMKIPVGSPLARCPLWLADFTNTRPATPVPWHEITIWQHSSTGSVPGIGGNVDLDAGAPPVEGPGPITHHAMHVTTKTGGVRRFTSQTPMLWHMAHPRAKKRGPWGGHPVRG